MAPAYYTRSETAEQQKTSNKVSSNFNHSVSLEEFGISKSEFSAVLYRVYQEYRFNR